MNILNFIFISLGGILYILNIVNTCKIHKINKEIDLILNNNNYEIDILIIICNVSLLFILLFTIIIPIIFFIINIILYFVIDYIKSIILRQRERVKNL